MTQTSSVYVGSVPSGSGTEVLNVTRACVSFAIVRSAYP
jgi:hypothetical protein